MANLLSMLGLGSSGVPVSLDDETAQLMAQSPTSGWSALMGAQQGAIAPQQMQQYMAQAGMPQSVQQDDGSQASAQDANAVASDSTGNVASQDSKVAKGDMQNAAVAQQVDQSGYSGDDSSGASGSAGAAPNNSDNASTASNASADQSGNTASSPDATTSSDKSLLSAVGGNSQSASSDASPSVGEKLMSVLRNPLINESLMNAGFGMMAASRPGTPWYSAIGQGAQTGVQTYNQLAQQQIANRMAALNYQRQNALDQADINAKNAGTAATQMQTQQASNLKAYMQKAGNNFSVTDAIAAGANPDAALNVFKTMHPEVQTVDLGTSIGLFDPTTRSFIQQVPKSQIVQTAPGATTSVITGNGAAGANGNAGASNGQRSSIGPVTAQPVVQGGPNPAMVTATNNAIKPYADAVQAAKTQGDQIDAVLGGLQTKNALTGNIGGVVGSGYRAAEQGLGIYDPNSPVRQQFQKMQVNQEMSTLPPNVKLNKYVDQQLGQTAANPTQATPAQMLDIARFNKVMANVHAVDNQARAAYVSANNGSIATSQNPITMNLGGKQISYPAGTSMEDVANDAKNHMVDYNPPVINPDFVSKGTTKAGKPIQDSDIKTILARAQTDVAYRQKMVSKGILLPSLFGGK